MDSDDTEQIGSAAGSSQRSGGSMGRGEPNKPGVKPKVLAILLSQLLSFLPISKSSLLIYCGSMLTFSSVLLHIVYSTSPQKTRDRRIRNQTSKIM